MPGPTADAWPSPDEVTSSRVAARWMPWALRLTVASLAIPIMRNPDGLGFADWDFVLDKFEAVRRTILVWHEFPWWNPWCRGGFPLAAEPQIGAVSMATPLVLALGTGIGLRVATILCMGIAVEGAYRLAWLWFREPWAAAAAAFVYGLNGAVSVDTATGYIIAMSYGSLRGWRTTRSGSARSPCKAAWLGFWMAFTSSTDSSTSACTRWPSRRRSGCARCASSRPAIAGHCWERDRGCRRLPADRRLAGGDGLPGPAGRSPGGDDPLG